MDVTADRLSSFASGLEQDLDAVTAGLTLRWNSGPSRDASTTFKMIKRQMYGRAAGSGEEWRIRT